LVEKIINRLSRDRELEGSFHSGDGLCNTGLSGFRVFKV